MSCGRTKARITDPEAVRETRVEESARSYSAPALEKGLDILEQLSTVSGPMTMTEIGTRIGRSRSEIFRNLRILEERGYIARQTGDRYVLTNKLFEIGMRNPPIAGLLEVAYPIMAEVARSLAQSLHIAVPSRGQMIVVARVESPGEVGFTVPIGHRRVLSEATSGQVLLAFQPEQVREQWIDLVKSALAGSEFDEPALRKRLKKIRRRGYFVTESATVVGVTDIGAPILGPDDAAIAALTMPLIRRRGRPNPLDEATEAVRDAARRIQAALRPDPSEG